MSLEIVTKEGLETFRFRLLDDLKTLLKEKESKKNKQWLRSSEVRKLLKISAGTLQALRIKGTITSSKIGGINYYPAEEIEKLLHGDSGSRY